MWQLKCMPIWVNKDLCFLDSLTYYVGRPEKDSGIFSNLADVDEDEETLNTSYMNNHSRHILF